MARGKVDPGKLRRDLAAFHSRPREKFRERFAAPIAGLFAVFEAARVATSPIRGTAAWSWALVIGVSAGAAGVAAWWALVRGSRDATVKGLAVFFAIALAIGLLATSNRSSPTELTTGFGIAATSYGAIGLASSAVLMWRMRRR